jgi:dipeptidyl aminopeptidase/acylaminoacyl peptidase
MRRLILLFWLVSFFVLPAFSQVKHPFTFEDMMKLKRVGEPVPSPDGKWVLFSAVDVDLAANKKTPHIWIVPLSTDGGRGPSTPPEASPAVQPPAPVGMTSGERVLIADQEGDRPRWSPDGKRFAFISNKEGGSQVWIADFDGAAGSVTAVRKLTSIATEAGGELWSPDGKNILFTSDVYPECDDKAADELSCNERKHKEVEESKVKAIIFDRLLYRHWNAYKRGTRTHIFVTRIAGLDEVIGGAIDPTPRDLTPGDYDAPVFSLGGQDDYAFSPDGLEICYTSNHDKVPAISTNNDLWTVPVNWPAEATPAEVLAKTKNISADNPASDSTPLYSPDGKYIAYRAQSRPGYESDRFRLMLYDRKTGEKKDVLKDQRGRVFRMDTKTGERKDVTNFDTWVGTTAWAPDSKTMYFSSEVLGLSMIHSVEVGSLDHLNRQTGGGYDDDLVISPDGRQIIFNRMSVRAPNEVYVARIGGYKDISGGGTLRTTQLSHLNDAILAQIDMPPLEEFWFDGAHGDKVEGFLVKPPNFDPSKKYPVKFLLHGGPEGAWGDDWSYRWNPELFAAPTPSVSSGYVVIMINFHGSTGYGQKFVDAINGDWGGAPFEDLMKGMDYAEKTYPFIDKDRECALGASYGGYAANWLLGHTDRFKCIVSHDGMFNAISAWGTTEELWFNQWEFKGTPYTNREMYDKWSPSNYAKNFKTPTLVVHGQLDYRLDVSEGFQLFTTLQTMGVPSKMLYFPDEGHWVLKPQNSQLWWKTVDDWVDQWIGSQK